MFCIFVVVLYFSCNSSVVLEGRCNFPPILLPSWVLSPHSFPLIIHYFPESAYHCLIVHIYYLSLPLNCKCPYTGLSVLFVPISPVFKTVPGQSRLPVTECMNDLVETERSKPVSETFGRQKQHNLEVDWIWKMEIKLSRMLAWFVVCFGMDSDSIH